MVNQNDQQDQQDGNDEAQQNAQPIPNQAVNRIQVKIPPFWKQNPELWFKQLEAQFTNSNIVNELTKFNHIVGVIDTDILDHVSDIVLTPPAIGQYEAIKQRLIKAFTASEFKKLQSLLTELTLGDLKPSDLLRKMRDLSCNKVGDELLKTLWIQRLPSTIQTVISTMPDDLTQLSTLADTMFEVAEASKIQAITTSQPEPLSDLVSIVHKLDGKIESLKRSFRGPGKSSRQKARSRSPTPVKTSSVAKDTICYYHKHFGQKANKCKHPCNFHTKPKN